MFSRIVCVVCGVCVGLVFFGCFLLLCFFCGSSYLCLVWLYVVFSIKDLWMLLHQVCYTNQVSVKCWGTRALV